jgi:hypothetical protein
MIEIKLYGETITIEPLFRVKVAGRRKMIDHRQRIPQSVRKEALKWAKKQIIRHRNETRSPEAWEKRILRKIKDPDIQVHCARAIWFRYSIEKCPRWEKFRLKWEDAQADNTEEIAKKAEKYFNMIVNC